MDPLFPVALQYIREVQSQISGDGRRTYDQFRQTLIQYSHRVIDSSTAISTVQKLFHDNQTLLDSFKPFVPSQSHRAAAPPAENPKLRCCLDFLNRVRARFHGGRAYAKFLDCMHAYARAEMSACDVRDKALRLLGQNHDLLDEFMGFLPESCVDRDFEVRQRGMKRRRGSDSSSHDDEETAADRDFKVRQRGSPDDAPRRTVRRRLDRFGREEEAAARRATDRDNEMEDSLCEIDVKIGNLKACINSAEELHRALSAIPLNPADLRLHRHFTPLNLACIRSLDTKPFLKVADEDLGSKLKEVLNKKQEGLERERVKIVQKWNRIRQTQ